MSKVIFQPAGNAGGRDHYIDTIANPVPIERLAGFLAPELVAELRASREGDVVPVWGVTPGANGVNERKWQRIDPGDLALFLQGGKAVSAGRVTAKAHAPELAKELWGAQPDGQTWEYIYFLDRVIQIEVPYADLNAAAGYDPGNRFQGFTVLDGPQTDAIIALADRRSDVLPTVRLPKVWCVRAGREGVALAQFLDQGVVAIGWNDVGDIRRFGDDSKSLRAALQEKYEGEDAGSAAGVIRRFVAEIARGDVVLTPAADAIYVGRVVGEAEHEPSGTFHNVRAVEWLTAVSRGSLTHEMQSSIGSQLSVFRVWKDTERWLDLAAKGPRMATRPSGAAAWLVRQSSGSRYRDLEGIEYEYPARIPNGRQIQADDVLVCYRNQDEAAGKPIFGIGRIGRLDPRGAQVVAVYDRYIHLDPPLSWEEMGGDPRNNTRNSINALPADALARLLQRLGMNSIEDLPHVGTREAPAIAERAGEWRRGTTMEDLIRTTHWTREELDELCQLIRERAPQVILAGPPGTSKTWVARNVCRFLTQAAGQQFKIVQFHPSYSYEEFIEGLRPDANDQGVILFRPVPGVLLRLLDIAGDRPGPHILLIDEINRANLPKVLGELMYLFEYRDEKVDLRYRSDFSLPASMRFVGTMNTADRSIRSIDSALRRRFSIVECPPRRDVLERYYVEHQNDVPSLLDGFESLNAELTRKLDRHHTIGHAFFMESRMTRPRLRDAWKYKIAPLLEEYFFDQPDVAATFTLEQFWPPA